MSYSAGVKLLAVTSTTARSILRERLAPIDHLLTCVSTVEEIADLCRRGEIFEVVLLPEKLADLDWWLLWGEISNLDPPPIIIVYSKQPTFRLWTAVLDLGGFGVVSEPFEEQEIRQVVIDAAHQFLLRARSSTT
jgi:DNA-binding NtrC family response regulator